MARFIEATTNKTEDSKIEIDDTTYTELKYVSMNNKLAIFAKYVEEIFNKKEFCDVTIGKLNKELEIKDLPKSRVDLIKNELNILNTQRTLYKLLANSFYGALGSVGGALFEVSLAIAVTSGGRKVFKQTCNIIENELNGSVIFGDTDSAMFTLQNKREIAQSSDYQNFKSQVWLIIDNEYTESAKNKEIQSLVNKACDIIKRNKPDDFKQSIDSNNNEAIALLSTISPDNMSYISPSTAIKLIHVKINTFMNQGQPNRFNLKMEELAVRYYAPKDIKKCYSKLIYKGPHDWENTTLPIFITTPFEEIITDPIDFVEHKFK